MYYSYDEKAVHIFEDSFFVIVIILFVFFRFKSTKKFRIFVIKKFPIYKMIYLASSISTLKVYECLILEHHMAASRFSFGDLYTPLNESKEFDSALRKGEIAEISFLANTISPLVKAHQANNTFEIAKIVRQGSPLLSKKALSLQPDKQKQKLEQAESATQSLIALWDDGKVIALKTALNVPFDEMERYAVYVSEQSRFATHQGVKGLEYPRVMVVLDDSEARGFLFSYEKLFGAKEKTPTDLKNEKEGKDTSIQRTARLFYVACTRAMESLAVVAYSENPTLVRSPACGCFNQFNNRS